MWHGYLTGGYHITAEGEVERAFTLVARVKLQHKIAVSSRQMQIIGWLFTKEWTHVLALETTLVDSNHIVDCLCQCAEA